MSLIHKNYYEVLYISDDDIEDKGKIRRIKRKLNELSENNDFSRETDKNISYISYKDAKIIITLK